MRNPSAASASARLPGRGKALTRLAELNCLFNLPSRQQKLEMHVVLAKSWYPPYSTGGVATHHHNLARGLVKLGHRVTVIASRPTPDICYDEDHEGVRVLRIHTHYWSWPRRLPVIKHYLRSIRHLAYSRQVARALVNLEAEDRPDIVEFPEVEAEGFIYLRRRRRCPVVVRCHTPTFVLQRYYLPHEMSSDVNMECAMERYCIHHADALSAPSRDMARTVAHDCSLPENRIVPIGNAVDVESYSGAIRRRQSLHGNGNGKSGLEAGPKKERDTIHVLHVGRLDRAKGIEVLAQAIPRVLGKFPSVRFVFVGPDRPDGLGSTWQARLLAIFRERQVAECVSFAGEVDEKGLLTAYAQADLAVVPSMLYESFSFTCAQAMAAGLAVVATRIGGVPDTVDDGVTGLITSPGNVEELTAALLRLCGDSALRSRMGQLGYEKVRNQFDISIIAARMVELYEEAVASRSALTRNHARTR